MDTVRIGDMLVAAGFASRSQVDQAAQSQASSGLRLGEELIQLGFVSEVQLTQTLSNQLSVPWVSLYHVEFSRELLNLIPARLAHDHVVIPVYKRRVRFKGETLFVAMRDPSNVNAIRRISEATKLPVKAMVAPPSEIENAIRVYYFNGTVPPPRARLTSEPNLALDKNPEPLIPEPTQPEVKPTDITLPEFPAPMAVEPNDDNEVPEENIAPVPEARVDVADNASTFADPEDEDFVDTDVREMPEARAQKDAWVERERPRMRTITLLDGTELQIPTKDNDPVQPPRETTASLLASLSAAPEGANWEALFQTLLSLMLRKGVISDREFVEAWARKQEP